MTLAKHIRGTTVPISIAPMMDCTDRHYRAFMRRLTKRTLLYTEMITARAIIHGDRDHLLGYDECEHPISLQIGGDDAAMLAECARIAVDYGYDEVNLNIGCPSDRVQSGNFGACLMKEPETVAAAVTAMRRAVDIPVTVKHRIGVDDIDRYEDMLRFVTIVAEAGADRFSVHARKAWLQGLSPKENRNIPPLRYEDVYRLKVERPDLPIEINGGIRTVAETKSHLKHVDAVMIGRAAYGNPYLFAEMDSALFNDHSTTVPSRDDVALGMQEYIEQEMIKGQKPFHVLRHMLHLYAGCPGAKAWKRTLTERCHQDGVGPEVVQEAVDAVRLTRAKVTAVQEERAAYHPT